MKKREFIKTGFALGAGIFASPLMGYDQLLNDNQSNPAKGFTQIKLPYSYDALEPYIDAATMELHYSKHHAGYTSNFNKAAAEEGLLNKSQEETFSTVSKHSASIRNNGGGFYNHNLFWQCMKPGTSTSPKGAFRNKIEKTFGSFDEFKSQFAQKAASVFGSGWAWLISQNGNLIITSTPNQDNPLMDVAKDKGTPLLALDVWEHAYYLKYQNRRADYISAFWNLVDWDFVESRY